MQRGAAFVSLLVCSHELVYTQCTGSGFVLPQSLLFASSVDTLLQVKFCGVTFVSFMRYTD